jgi:hypothetical protein
MLENVNNTWVIKELLNEWATWLILVLGFRKIKN